MMKASDLPAGRELDALVAERVIGWQWMQWDRLEGIPEDHQGRFLALAGQPEAHAANMDLPLAKHALMSVPYYSTDIDAAWHVVEAMRARWAEQDNAKRGEPDAWQFQDFADEGWGASVIWLHHDGPIDMVIDIAPTLPLAICRAALAYTERVGAAR